MIVAIRATRNGRNIIPGNKFSLKEELKIPVNNPEHSQTIIIPHK